MITNYYLTIWRFYMTGLRASAIEKTGAKRLWNDRLTADMYLVRKLPKTHADVLYLLDLFLTMGFSIIFIRLE
jgi:hypothetical protein